MSRPTRATALLLLLWLAPAGHLALARAEPETDGAPDRGEVVELIPEQRASWSAGNLVAPFTGFFRGNPDYWYEDRTIHVQTTPPGAELDLFYVRSNFQKGFEQAQAPVTIKLPSRIEAGPRDTVMIRALLDGYRQAQKSVKVRSSEQEVMLDLEPLPNALVALSHTYIGGRGSLTFLTKEALTFRLQKRDDGIQVVLTQTGEDGEAEATIEGLSSALVAGARAQQLGEDLVVSVTLTEAARDGVEIRSRQDYDPVRGLHSFTLDLVPPDGGVAAVNRARAALAGLRPSAVTGCALVFDETLRQELDPAALARALTPRGSFIDPYVRAVLKRLGELSPAGKIVLVDGSSYRVDVPIELSAAATQIADAKGYLALLRAFIAALEPAPYRRATLRGLIAPEVGTARFDTIVDTADAREQRCRTNGS